MCAPGLVQGHHHSEVLGVGSVLTTEVPNFALCRGGTQTLGVNPRLPEASLWGTVGGKCLPGSVHESAGEVAVAALTTA